MQGRLAKESFVEGITNPKVCAKLRDLRPATLKDALDEECMLQDKREAKTQKACLTQE